MKCEVIIPIGPGHEELAAEAVNSVIMAADVSKGPFSEVSALPVDDTQGRHGRSKARNLAVKKSLADWVYYLDADDVVTPDLFSSITDYIDIYDAIWGKIGEINGILINERFQTWGFTQYEDLLKYGPHYTVKIGHFIKREIALKYPFNTGMHAGEDWEYYLRVWKKEKCIKIGGPVVYLKRRGLHSKGPKSATGRDWNIAVDAQFKAARKEAGM